MDLQKQVAREQQRKEYIIIDDRFRTQIVKSMDAQYISSDIDKMIKAVNQEDITQQHIGIIGIRTIICQHYYIEQQIINAGIVPKLISFASQQQYPQLQFQGLWILTKLAKRTLIQCRSVVELEIIPLCIRLVQSSNSYIAQKAVTALGDRAFFSNSVKYQIIKKGGSILIDYLRNLTDSEAINNCCQTLSYLCCKQPIPQFQYVSELIAVLCETLAKGHVTDKQSIVYCCWAIKQHSDNSEKQKVILQSGVLPKLVDFLKEYNRPIISSCLVVLRNLSQRQEIAIELMSLNIVGYLQRLVQQQNIIYYLAYHILSILANYRQPAQAIMNNQKLLKLVLKTLQSDPDTRGRSKINQFFSNLADKVNSRQLYDFLKNTKVIGNTVLFISTRKPNDQTIQVALKLLYQLIILQQKYSENCESSFTAQLRMSKSSLQKLNISQRQSILNRLKMIQMYLDG